MLICALSILYLPKQSAFHTGGKAHSTLNTKALSPLFPYTPPFLFTFSKNSQMSFTSEAVICNCYFISALRYHFPFARINVSVGIQHSIISFIAWACAFLREHLSSLKICVLCLYAGGKFPNTFGKTFSQAWKKESSVFSD